MTGPAGPREAPGAPTAAAAWRFVVLMGVVAMFGDMTYEGARGLVGAYLGALGASAAAVGFAAGLGEFLGYGLRLASGWLAERTRAYWPITFLGYAINLVAVPGLALTGRWEAALALLLLERVGKAVRSPARSTLVSFAARAVGPGKSFGLEEALDQLGAVSGPLLALLAMRLSGAAGEADRYRAGFAVLLLPVVANLGTLALARRTFPHPETFEPEAAPGADPSAGLGGSFRMAVLAAALVGLGFADWALVAYHATRTGLLHARGLALVYALAMGADGLAALAFGWLFDRIGLRALALAALASAAFAPLVFLGSSPALFCAGVLAWSAGMGAQESIFKAAIATLVPREQRSRAYGVFFALFGLAWWAGSAAMGALYDRSIPAL
ncbi:MAG TPA: MFS transporter, partial [Planctomycetota bacterium]|nr:MFS transporter [Planctomycetota bacterium]